MKFNNTKNGAHTTVNHEGAKAYSMSNELELYSLVCTSIFENKFYEKNADAKTRMQDLVAKCDHKFVAKLAVYAREKMYLRSMPIALTVELAKIHNGDKLVSNLTSRVIQRADEINELLSYYQVANPKKGRKQ